MNEDELIKKINNFTKLSKQRELTDIEKKEREELRKKFLENFKKNMKQTLDNIKIVNKK